MSLKNIKPNNTNKLHLNLMNEYVDLLHTIKHKVYTTQLKATVSVNQAMLNFYWELGNIINSKAKKYKLGR